MSDDPSRAVFLSYASQDAAAAKRICDALRAAGVEVWFDQNELVGGDAWDQKIRRQIRDCTLLIPVISQTTQARREAYFRLEWRLAEERTHLMAKGTPFLLPVTIDETTERGALVPDSFVAVQWTKAPAGELPPAFVARVGRLLRDDHEPAGGAELPRTRPAAVAARRPAWMIPAALGVVGVAAVALWQPWKQPAAAEPGPAKPAASPVTEARKLANQALQMLEDPNFTRESSWLADELCQRALALDAADAEVWAIAAMSSLNLYWNSYDSSAARLEKINSQATRAAQLDPKSVRAALMVARSLDANYENAEQTKALRDLHRRAPEDQHVIFHLIRAEGRADNDAAVRQLLAELRALPRTGMLALAQWYEVLRLRTAARYAEAEAILQEMTSGPETVRGAYYEKLQLLLGSWHDLAEVEPYLETIPARFRREPAFGSAIAQYWLWRQQPEKALQALSLVPQDYFEEYYASEPKAWHAGWAHTLAGRPAAAQAEWRSALALVEVRLKADARNFTLLNQRAILLALTGQTAAAREAWQLRVELGGQQERPNLASHAQFYLALRESEPAIAAIESGWRTLKPGYQVRVLPMLRFHPAFAAVRADPRLQAIIADGSAMLQRLQIEQTRARPAAGGAAPVAALPVDEKSVAVLAFANLSDDKANEFFSDGVTEEVLNALTKVPGLKTSARTSAFYFKGRNVPVAEIAQQLGVAYVVEGSVRKAGDKVRISAQLIKAADGFHVWSETFTRDLKDIFAVQDEIARLIAENLSVRIASDPAAAATRSVEHYDTLLRARSFARQENNDGWRRALELYREVLRQAPNTAAAWSGLADAYVQLGRFNGLPALEAMNEARAAARRALEISPDDPTALVALGWVARTADWNWREARRYLARALEVQPGNSATLAANAILELNLGNLEGALALAQRAVAADPLNAGAHFNVGVVSYMLGRPAEALPHYQRAIALAPQADEYHCHVAVILGLLGRHDEARREIEREVHPGYRLVAVGHCAALRGDLAEAARARDELIARYADDFPGYISDVCASQQDWDGALQWLERAIARRDNGVPWFKCDLWQVPLRSHPRWQELIRRIGMLDEQLK